MKLKNEYDIVVYGAGISAVRHAVNQKRMGKEVLLINQYGFLGGAVTEAYSCLQSVNNLSIDNFTKNLLDENFYLQPNFAILNPEHVKIILQQELQEAEVDMLFHVLPEKISVEKDSADLYMIAKEGNVSIRAKRIIDGTEHGHLFSLKENNIKIGVKSVNLFVTEPDSDLFLAEKNEIMKVKLNDERYWLSVQINQKQNDFYDYGEHELILSLEDLIKKFKSRIQLLPVRSEFEFINRTSSGNECLVHISELSGKNYSIHEELLRSESIINSD